MGKDDRTAGSPAIPDCILAGDGLFDGGEDVGFYVGNR